MKKLILVRHGEYDYRDLRLNEYGIEQITQLAEDLKPFVKGLSIKMISSPAPRAADSAKILADAFGVQHYDSHEMLWSGDSPRPQNNDNAMRLIRANADAADLLVLVTHLEYSKDLPPMIGDELGVEFRTRALERGEAFVIDWEKKTVVKI